MTPQSHENVKRILTDEKSLSERKQMDVNSLHRWWQIRCAHLYDNPATPLTMNEQEEINEWEEIREICKELIGANALK